MIRVAIIACVLHSGGKRNLIMEYYRHIDHSKVQFDFICDSDSNGIPEKEIESLGGRVYKVAPYKNIIPHLKETYKILKENRYEVMHAFDNFLLPSLYEGMPVVGVEAQCCGLPIFFSKNITEETTASELAHYNRLG